MDKKGRSGRKAGATATDGRSNTFISRAAGQSLDVWWRHQSFAPVRPANLGLDESSAASPSELLSAARDRKSA